MIATCTKCGGLYEAGSEEQAYETVRLCFRCRVPGGKGGQYKLLGFDTFEGEFYPLEGSYPSVEEAETAAQDRLTYLEAIQPAKSSGGQKLGGIQDRVYIVGPGDFPKRVMPRDGE